MKKIRKISCKTCKKMFVPKSDKNIYCCRSHFKRAYYKRQKEMELKRTITFPIFKCPLCNKNIELDFDPLKFDNRWLDFRCPICYAILSVGVSDNISAKDTSNL